MLAGVLGEPHNYEAEPDSYLAELATLFRDQPRLRDCPGITLEESQSGYGQRFQWCKLPKYWR